MAGVPRAPRRASRRRGLFSQCPRSGFLTSSGARDTPDVHCNRCLWDSPGVPAVETHGSGSLCGASLGRSTGSTVRSRRRSWRIAARKARVWHKPCPLKPSPWQRMKRLRGAMAGGDGACEQLPCLGASGHARDHDTWHVLMEQALAGLNCQIIQSTSDEAPGLLAYVEQHLGVHHSPDLFHVQYELIKAVSGHWPQSSGQPGRQPLRRKQGLRGCQRGSRTPAMRLQSVPRSAPTGYCESGACGAASGGGESSIPAYQWAARAVARSIRHRPGLPLCRFRARCASQR